MDAFNAVFNKSNIYEMLFINVKSVLIFQTLNELKEKNKLMYDHWVYISENKFESGEKSYQKNAPNYPEFSKIVAISYAKLHSENGQMKRFLKKIVNIDESILLMEFMEVLDFISKECMQSKPVYFPTLCDYNIIGYDIPFLIKRFIFNKEKLNNKELPQILKNAMTIKPWESGIIDANSVWKFNGFEYNTLPLIAEFMGLKKTVDLLSNSNLSEYYWNNIDNNPEETLKFVSLQSATQINLVIQLMNELRQL